MTNANASVYKKMALVMGEINRVPKNGRNAKFNYDFATAEDVKDVVRKAMSKHNLALLIDLPEYEIETFKTTNATGTRVRGNIIYTLACGETGATVTTSMPMEAVDYQDKVFSKLYTIGLKYFLINTFAISTGDEIADDPDAEGETAAVTQKQTKKQPKKQPPPPKATAPTSPDELMTLANDNLETEYLSPVHMLNAIKKHTGAEDYTWPKPDDAEGWRFAYKQLKEYKESKDAPLFEGVEEIPFE